MKTKAKLLREENNAREKVLNDEANKILTDIVVYIRAANISDYSQELIRRDITEMLIDGQERGMTAAEVIGDDYKLFCDEVIAEMPQLTPCKKLLTSIRDVLPGVCILAAIWLVFSEIGQLAKGGDLLHISLTASQMITAVGFVAIAVIIVSYITERVFDEKPIRLILALAAVVLAAALAYIIIPDSTTAVLINPHIICVVAVIAALYTAYLVIEKTLDK